MTIKTAVSSAIGAAIYELMRRKMFKLEDKNKWTRPIDAEFVNVAGAPKSSSDYDRVWNKPRGWVPPHQRHSPPRLPRTQVKAYRKHVFGRFVRACLYMWLAGWIGYKYGLNNPIVPLDTRSHEEITQFRAQMACENLKAYKLAKMPDKPWDVAECAAYKGK